MSTVHLSQMDVHRVRHTRRWDPPKEWRQYGTVDDLLQDPTGEAARARKARYARPCADCGKTINPNGPRPEITRCNRCEPRHNAAWDRERIIAALRDFYDEHGRAPTAGEMGSGPYRDDRLESLPLGATVRRHFGSVAAALEEAGIPPNRAGRWVHSPRPGDLVGGGS